MAILGQTVTRGAPDLLTFAGAGLVKYTEERLLASTFVGNGTLLSAGVKGAIAVGAHHFAGGNRIGDMVAMGFMTDAVEDALTSVLGSGSLFGGLGFGGGNATASTW